MLHHGSVRASPAKKLIINSIRTSQLTELVEWSTNCMPLSSAAVGTRQTHSHAEGSLYLFVRVCAFCFHGSILVFAVTSVFQTVVSSVCSIFLLFLPLYTWISMLAQPGYLWTKAWRTARPRVTPVCRHQPIRRWPLAPEPDLTTLDDSESRFLPIEHT